ncbi:hypothetical protein BH10BDE1_BH10BDE1_16570 [soil metagenome]
MVVILCTLALAACATSPKPGEFEKRGLASWYGPRHHGKKTANGETFDMNAMTAAHRTLAFNTWVTVRSVISGKSVKVRINDRGPYSGHRIIDLSREAAKRLGMISRGEEEVELTVE